MVWHYWTKFTCNDSPSWKIRARISVVLPQGISLSVNFDPYGHCSYYTGRLSCRCQCCRLYDRCGWDGFPLGVTWIVHTLQRFIRCYTVFDASFSKTRPEFLRVHVPTIPYIDTCVLVSIYLCMHSSYMMRPDFYVKGQDLCGIRIVRCTVIKSVPIGWLCPYHASLYIYASWLRWNSWHVRIYLLIFRHIGS